MENENFETCPICYENDANCFTECNHGYCITCLQKINKCAICRKNLTHKQSHNNLLREIRNYHYQKNLKTNNDNNNSGINIYSFELKPEDHRPSGTMNFSRIQDAIDDINYFRHHNSGVHNFSRIDNGTLRLTLNADYPSSIHVLRTASGMIGAGFSN